jgi:hypothetical protein
LRSGSSNIKDQFAYSTQNKNSNQKKPSIPLQERGNIIIEPSSSGESQNP